MTFKFFTASSRRVPFRRKGRSDGRLTSQQFDKFVRKPFEEKLFKQSVNNTRGQKKYDVFDQGRIQYDLRNSRREANFSSTQHVVKQLKSERRNPSGQLSPRGFGKILPP